MGRIFAPLIVMAGALILGSSANVTNDAAYVIGLLVDAFGLVLLGYYLGRDHG